VIHNFLDKKREFIIFCPYLFHCIIIGGKKEEHNWFFFEGACEQFFYHKVLK